MVSLWSILCFGQNSGNINYQREAHGPPAQSLYSSRQSAAGVQLPVFELPLSFNSNNELYISAKGMYNVEADSYIALFGLTQIGKTTDEVYEQLEKRITYVQEQLSSHPDAELYVDMVSFVPIYEYEEENKVFSRNSYNEIPAGFEIKKTLHIHFEEVNTLNDLMKICSKVEIYDLIRVDYLSHALELNKQELRQQADSVLAAKIGRISTLLNYPLDSMDKQIVEGFQTIYPLESYQSYQAFSRPSFQPSKGKVNSVHKTPTSFHQPIVNKDFDFVINPIMLEPSIQLIYEIRIKIKQPIQQIPLPQKEFFMLTPTGELVPLRIGS